MKTVLITGCSSGNGLETRIGLTKLAVSLGNATLSISL